MRSLRVNIVSVNSVHEQLHRNFIWKSLKKLSLFRRVSFEFAIRGFLGEYLS